MGAPKFFIFDPNVIFPSYFCQVTWQGQSWPPQLPLPSLPVICWQTCPNGCHNANVKHTSKQKRSKTFQVQMLWNKSHQRDPWRRDPLDRYEWAIKWAHYVQNYYFDKASLDSYIPNIVAFPADKDPPCPKPWIINIPLRTFNNTFCSPSRQLLDLETFCNNLGTSIFHDLAPSLFWRVS